MNTDLIYRAKQSLVGFRTDYHGSVPVRAVIERNAYDFQSYARAEVWTAHGWVTIQQFPIGQFSVAAKSYVSKPGEWEHLMQDDLAALLIYAHQHMAHVPSTCATPCTTGPTGDSHPPATGAQ